MDIQAQEVDKAMAMKATKDKKENDTASSLDFHANEFICWVWEIKEEIIYWI